MGPKTLIVVEVVGGRTLFRCINYFVNRVACKSQRDLDYDLIFKSHKIQSHREHRMNVESTYIAGKVHRIPVQAFIASSLCPISYS